MIIDKFINNFTWQSDVHGSAGPGPPGRSPRSDASLLGGTLT